MPQIEISDETLAMLKRHAVPFEDTPDTVIKRFGKSYEARGGHDGEAGDDAVSKIALDASITTYKADSPPDLSFTKVLSAKLNGKVAAKPMWNRILKEMIVVAKTRAKNEDDLRRLISVNFVMGRKEDEGYEYLPDAGLSVQGQDTPNAWKGIVHLSRQLDLPVEIVFVWRPHAKAAHPGKTGRLST